MANRSKKALNAWIDANIMKTMEDYNGHMASTKGAYYLSAYFFLIYACSAGAQRATSGYQFINRICSARNESLQNVYLEIAQGLSDMANFDFILNQKETHDLIKKLLNETEEEANKYSYDDACKYLIIQMYIRTAKIIGYNWEKIATWVIDDHFAPREERIAFIKSIK